MFHVISDAEYRQLHEDLAEAEGTVAALRMENIRLAGWNRSLGRQVRDLEQFLATGLSQEITHHWVTARRSRETIAHLRGDVAQLRLQLVNRAPIAPWVDAPPRPEQPPAAAEPAAEPGVEDTQRMEVFDPGRPDADVVRLGSSAWATEQQITALQAAYAS